MTISVDSSDTDLTISGGEGTDTLTLNMSNYPNISSNSSITVPYTISTGGAGTNGYVYTSTGSGTSWVAPNVHTTTQGTIKVTGDADFDGDVKIKGHSLIKLLESIEDRLAILMDPDPERLEKFQALKKAYDNYKLMDKLCQETPEEDK